MTDGDVELRFASMPAILTIPGWTNSGPEHWQTHWEGALPDCRRVEQKDWDTPRCSDWVEQLERVVADLQTAPVLVAHSLGCATVAHWARSTRRRVRGALLVAPADVEAAGFPVGPTGFTPMPTKKLLFASVVVASDDDPFVSPARAEKFARAWGSRLVMVGEKGHMNSASQLADWPDGQLLLRELLAQSA
jgi:predicted alpha/beta hydrolase family esterase